MPKRMQVLVFLSKNLSAIPASVGFAAVAAGVGVFQGVVGAVAVAVEALQTSMGADETARSAKPCRHTIPVALVRWLQAATHLRLVCQWRSCRRGGWLRVGCGSKRHHEILVKVGNLYHFKQRIEKK